MCWTFLRLGEHNSKHVGQECLLFVLDDQQFKKGWIGNSWRSIWCLFASLVFKKALYPARHGRPDLLWTVNYLTRSVTKWNRACGTRLAGSISHIHHTWNHRQYCHVGNKASECKLVPFHDQDFAGDMTDSKFTSEGVLCVLGSQTCVSVSRSCEKQTGVSQSSTEAENTSFDAGLRMEGILHWVCGNTVIDLLEPLGRGDLQQCPKQCKPKEASQTQRFFWRFRLCDTEHTHLQQG